VKRINLILVGLLAVQIALGVVVYWPKPAQTSGEEPFFPDLQVSDITGLSITDADGNSVQLKAVNGEWVLPEADDYPAQESKITPMLEKLLKLNTGRLVTRTDASHKRLQVAKDDFVRRVELETTDGARYTLYVGSSPRYGAVHVRLEGQSEVYLTNVFSPWEIGATPRDWVDPQYLSLSQEDISKITLENAGGELVFTKVISGSETGGFWTLADLAEGESVDDNKVNTLLGQVASVTLLAPLGKEERDSYGMDEPSATATIETSEGTVTLRVGAKDSEGNYVVKASTEPYYVTVSGYAVNHLVEDTREDFLQAPPTPAPDEASGTE